MKTLLQLAVMVLAFAIAPAKAQDFAEIPATLDFETARPDPWSRIFNIAYTGDGGWVAMTESPLRLLKFDHKARLVSFSKPIPFRAPLCCSLVTRLIPWEGKVIVVGEFTQIGDSHAPGLARLNLDGSVDTSFVPPSEILNGNLNVFQLADGGLLVQLDPFRLIRLQPDGSLDRSFQLQPLTRPVEWAAESQSGSILLQFGDSQPSELPRWTRILRNGAVDTSYTPAINNCPSEDCAGATPAIPMPDGSLIVTSGSIGEGTRQFRMLMPNGALDSTFQVPISIAGTYTISGALKDGRLLGASFGTRGPSFSILNSDGSRDTSHPGFTVQRSNDDCGQRATILSDALAEVGGCVSTVNGRSSYGVNGYRKHFVRLKGPFPNIIYTSAEELRAEPSANDATFQIIRAGHSSGLAKVHYRTVDGTARAGLDYVATSGEVSFEPQEVSKPVTIPLTSAREFSTRFHVELSDAVGAEVRGSPMPVVILGKKPRFAERPIEHLPNGAVMLHYERNGPSADGWELQFSDDLAKWIPLWTTSVEPYDFEAGNAKARYYRFLKR